MGINKVLDKIQRDIAREGWSAIAVLPTVDDPPDSDRFVYTIGLDPELIIVGLTADQGHGILSTAARLQKDGEKFESGDRREDIIVDYEVEFREVAEPFREEYLRAAHTLRNGEFTALQIVWPDAGRRFPWDEGYEYPPTMQTILSVDNADPRAGS